jgi:hypothetical protein
MSSAEIYEQLKRHVRDELRSEERGGHGGGCPQCIREDGGATWGGCPVIDEFMVERVISTCSAGLEGMRIAERPGQPVQLTG